jgi:phospholipase C
VVLHGPNGFLREFAGTPNGTGVEVTLTPDVQAGGPMLRIEIGNHGPTATVTVGGRRTGGGGFTCRVAAGASVVRTIDLAGTGGWYDLTATVAADPAFRRRFAGHVETGTPSITG